MGRGLAEPHRVGGSGREWATVGESGEQWERVGHSGTQWDTAVGHSGTLQWDTVGHSGPQWATVGETESKGTKVFK